MWKKIKIFKAKLKQIFMLKYVITFFVFIFVVLFFVGGGSTLFIDPRTYIMWLYVCKNMEKQTIYDKNLYDKLMLKDSYRGEKITEEIIEINDEINDIFDKIDAKAISQKKILGITETQYEWYLDKVLVGEGVGYDLNFYFFKLYGDEASGFGWYWQKSDMWCNPKRVFIKKNER